MPLEAFQKFEGKADGGVYFQKATFIHQAASYFVVERPQLQSTPFLHLSWLLWVEIIRKVKEVVFVTQYKGTICAWNVWWKFILHEAMLIVSYLYCNYSTESVKRRILQEHRQPVRIKPPISAMQPGDNSARTVLRWKG